PPATGLPRDLFDPSLVSPSRAARTSVWQVFFICAFRPVNHFVDITVAPHGIPLAGFGVDDSMPHAFLVAHDDLFNVEHFVYAFVMQTWTGLHGEKTIALRIKVVDNAVGAGGHWFISPLGRVSPCVLYDDGHLRTDTCLSPTGGSRHAENHANRQNG